MTTKPLIAVTTDRKMVDGYHWHATVDFYSRAVAGPAGGIPVLVPSMGEGIDLNGLLDRVDGVLATGSRSNVHPALYGSDNVEETVPHDHDRDATTLPLIRKAVERGIPLLAICRGHQELNVAMGGTLASEIQNKPDVLDHRAPDVTDNDERFSIRQDVALTPGCILDAALAHHKTGQTVRVNSLHRQAVDTLGAGLTVEAVAPDGTIEGLSMPDAPGFVLSVQWHPEYWAARGTDPVSIAILERFGLAARDYANGRLGLAAE